MQNVPRGSILYHNFKRLLKHKRDVYSTVALSRTETAGTKYIYTSTQTTLLWACCTNMSFYNVSSRQIRSFTMFPVKYVVLQCFQSNTSFYNVSSRQIRRFTKFPVDKYVVLQYFQSVHFSQWFDTACGKVTGTMLVPTYSSGTTGAAAEDMHAHRHGYQNS